MTTTALRTQISSEPGAGLLVSVRRHLLVVALMTAIFAAAGYGIALSLPKQFSSTATLTVARPDTLPVYRTLSAGDASNRQLTIANQLHDSRTLQRAATALGTSATSLAGRLTVTPLAQTSLIEVGATAGTAAGAARTANAVVAAYTAVSAADEAQQTADSVTPLLASSTQLTGQIALTSKQLQARVTAIRTQVSQAFSSASTPAVPGAEDRAFQAALQTDPAFTSLRSALATQESQRDALTEKVRQLRVDGSLMGLTLSHVDAAVPPDAPSTLRPSRAGVLGALVGLLLGCGLAWRREDSSHSMTAARASSILDAPVLLEAVLPRGALNDLGRLGSFALGDGRFGSVAPPAGFQPK